MHNFELLGTVHRHRKLTHDQLTDSRLKLGAVMIQPDQLTKREGLNALPG